jgi:hypothetical protein
LGLTAMREAVIVNGGCFNHSVFAEITERRLPLPWSVE